MTETINEVHCKQELSSDSIARLDELKGGVSELVIWVLRHISTKRLYRAEYAIK